MIPIPSVSTSCDQNQISSGRDSFPTDNTRGGEDNTRGKTSTTVEEINQIEIGTGTGASSSSGNQFSIHAVDQSTTYSLNLGSGMASKGGVSNGISTVQSLPTVSMSASEQNFSSDLVEGNVYSTLSSVSLPFENKDKDGDSDVSLLLKRKADEICNGSS